MLDSIILRVFSSLYDFFTKSTWDACSTTWTNHKVIRFASHSLQGNRMHKDHCHCWSVECGSCQAAVTQLFMWAITLPGGLQTVEATVRKRLRTWVWGYPVPVSLGIKRWGFRNRLKIEGVTYTVEPLHNIRSHSWVKWNSFFEVTINWFLEELKFMHLCTHIFAYNHLCMPVSK